MKNKTPQQLRVGIFVTLGLFLTMTVIFLLTDISGMFESKYTIYARFNNISGLRMGAPVFLAGINVGKVEGIRFPTKIEERKVVVTIRVHSAYKDRVRADSEASIVTQGLLGDKAIFVTVGSPDKPEVENGGEIKVKQAFSLESFGELGGELIENINNMASNVNKILEDVKTKDSIIHALIYDPEGEKIVANLSGMMSSARSIVKEIQTGDGVLHGLIYDRTDKNVGTGIGKAIENFEGVSENFKKMSDKMEQGEGSIGGLINDPTVYYDLMTLLGNANRNKLLRTVIRATLATNEKDLIGE